MELPTEDSSGKEKEDDSPIEAPSKDNAEPSDVENINSTSSNENQKPETSTDNQGIELSEIKPPEEPENKTDAEEDKVIELNEIKPTDGPETKTVAEEDKVIELNEIKPIDGPETKTVAEEDKVIGLSEIKPTDGPETKTIAEEDRVIELNEIKPTDGPETKTVAEEDKVIDEIAGDTPKTLEKLPVVMTYETRDQRQTHVYGKINPKPSGQQTRQNIPPPPSYYPSKSGGKGQPDPQHPRGDDNHIHINPAYWCPYPVSVPANTPPCLAQLVDIDSLYIVKDFEIIELLTGYSEPDTYLIQNKNGENLYYAYEVFDLATVCCNSERRSVQLIIKDVYQNEVIFLNKFCGCNDPCFFCCYPVMEVYAPPSVPVGAVIRVCESSRDDYLILDADENKMFKIYGSISGNFCPSCIESEYSIHALDRGRTLVGYIRRQVGDFRTYTTNGEVSAISFPQDLDVRIKAVFLGALMLIEITYFT